MINTTVYLNNNSLYSDVSQEKEVYVFALRRGIKTNPHSNIWRNYSIPKTSEENWFHCALEHVRMNYDVIFYTDLGVFGTW